MIHDPPIKLEFPSKMTGGKFSTMDGSKPVTSRTYTKYISTIMELENVELNYIVQQYSSLIPNLNKISTFIAKITP